MKPAEELLKEVLDNQQDMKSRCVEEGTVCVFCFQEEKRHVHGGLWSYYIIHDESCWLVRVSKLLGVDPPAFKKE